MQLECQNRDTFAIRAIYYVREHGGQTQKGAASFRFEGVHFPGRNSSILPMRRHKEMRYLSHLGLVCASASCTGAPASGEFYARDRLCRGLQFPKTLTLGMLVDGVPLS